MPSAFDEPQKGGGKKSPTTPTAAPAPRSGSAFAVGDGDAPASRPATLKKASLVGQATDILKATPSAMWNLTKAVGAEFDPLQRETIRAGEEIRAAAKAGKPLSAQEKRQLLSPATAMFAESAGNTVGNLRHPSRYVRASEEGLIVGKVLEDAANLSMVAAPVAKGLGAGATRASAGASKAAAAGNTAKAARLTKVAKAAETGQQIVRGAEHPLNLAANAGDPIFLTTRAAGLAKRGLQSDALRATSAGSKVASRVDSFSERRAARQDLADVAAEISKEQDRMGRIVARQKELLPDPAEIEATTLIRQGESKALAGLDSLPPVERQRVLDAAFSGGRAVSPEAFALARAFEDGTMPAEQRARFEEAIEFVEEGQQRPRTARELAGVGRKEGPLSAEQVGDQPLTPVVEGATRKLRQQAQRSQETAARLRRRADQAEWQAAKVRADLSDAADARGESSVLRRAEQERASLAQQAERAEARAAEAADRLTALQDRAEAAKVAPPRSAGEESALAAVTKAAGTRRIASHEMVTGERRVLPSLKRMSAADARIDVAGGRLSAAARRNGGTAQGRAAERARQGERVARLESRRARDLRAKEATIAPADPRPISTPGESRTLGAVEQRARILGNVAKSAEARAGRQTRTLAFVEKAISESIQAAPKRFRPALQRAADAGTELRTMAKEAQAQGNPHAAAYLRSVADDLPKVIADLTAAGIDPSHLIGGETPQFLGGSIGKKQRFLTLRKTGGEKQSKTTNITRTAEGQGALEAKRSAEAIKNVGAIQFRDKYAKTAADLGLDPTLSGDALKEAAFELGYKPFDTAALLEGPQKVTQDTVFLRKAMSDDFSRWFDDARPGSIVGAMHRVNRALSLPILRLSPRWQVGNAVSQAMQLSVGAGLTPGQIVKYGAEARRMLRDHPEMVPARFGHSGQFSGLLAPDLDSLGRPVNAPRTPIGKLAEKSGALNEWVDRWGKETVYLAKKAKGYSDEAAVKRALELQVDMRAMSNFERNYVQALMPYYAWARHITKLSLRLPFEHPTRVAWTLHLSDLYGDDQSQLPEWLKGGVRLEDGRFVNVGSVVNPFGDIAQSPLLSPSGALSALSPALRLGAAGLNIDLPKAQLLKRPVGTGPMDAAGKPKVGLVAPKELANVAVNALPQTRLAAGLVGTPVSRYPTGDPYLDSSGNPYPTERTRLNMAGRFVGVPTPEKINAEDIMAGAAANRQRVLKQRRNYLKKRGDKK